MHGQPALQHHMLAEHRRQRHICADGKDAEKQERWDAPLALESGHK
jgi:hypothetical protein